MIFQWNTLKYHVKFFAYVDIYFHSAKFYFFFYDIICKFNSILEIISRIQPCHFSHISLFVNVYVTNQLHCHFSFHFSIVTIYTAPFKLHRNCKSIFSSPLDQHFPSQCCFPFLLFTKPFFLLSWKIDNYSSFALYSICLVLSTLSFLGFGWKIIFPIKIEVWKYFFFWIMFHIFCHMHVVFFELWKKNSRTSNNFLIFYWKFQVSAQATYIVQGIRFNMLSAYPKLCIVCIVSHIS